MEITTSLSTTLIEPMDSDLEDAFGVGVTKTGGTPVLPAVSGYTGMVSGSKTTIKQTYLLIVAAIFKRLGGMTTTVAFRKPDGSSGTLTFTNGVLTGVA